MQYGICKITVSPVSIDTGDYCLGSAKRFRTRLIPNGIHAKNSIPIGKFVDVTDVTKACESSIQHSAFSQSQRSAEGRFQSPSSPLCLCFHCEFRCCTTGTIHILRLLRARCGLQTTMDTE